MRRRVCLLLGCSLLAAAGAANASASSRVVVRVFRFVDHSRRAHFRNGATGPRTLVTYVRYRADLTRPAPLVVFAHGFALTPGTYASLLTAWARAGFVVAAPAFPVEKANAPGGPDENDLVHEPADIRFVIGKLLVSLRGSIDPQRIAVDGHSDGAEAAFSVAYDRRFVDRRIRAALILSGAELPGFVLGGGPPLLAVQGAADPINAPVYSTELFDAVRRPKFLAMLAGASHLPPYTADARELAAVESLTIAFLDRYLARGSLARLLAAGRNPIVRLTADP